MRSLSPEQVQQYLAAFDKTEIAALGHSTIAVTADVYGHVSPSMLKNTANLLDRVVATGRKASGK